MPSYATKPPLSLKKTAEPAPTLAAPELETPELETPELEDKQIEIEPEFVSIAGLASQGRDALVEKLREHMVKSAPKEYVPPAPTERQMTQTQREMEAGRKAVARAADQQAFRPQPKREASDGYTVPAFRPADHVPNFDSKDPAARILK